MPRTNAEWSEKEIECRQESYITRAVIFDIDDTLVESWTSNPLPGRAEQLKKLKRSNLMLFGATNQGGTAWHLWHRLNERDDATRYPDLIQVINRLSQIRSMFGLRQIYAAIHPGQTWIMREIKAGQKLDEEQIYSYDDERIVTCWNKTWRKPKGGMIDKIRTTWYLDRKECLFVGNESRDAEAAREAGIRYMHEAEFFYQPPQTSVCKIGVTYPKDDHDEPNSRYESGQA